MEQEKKALIEKIIGIAVKNGYNYYVNPKSECTVEDVMRAITFGGTEGDDEYIDDFALDGLLRSPEFVENFFNDYTPVCAITGHKMNEEQGSAKCCYMFNDRKQCEETIALWEFEARELATNTNALIYLGSFTV